MDISGETDVLSSADGPPSTASALDALDDTIHQKARLAIMSTLCALGESDFRLLKETLALSDGNLSTHLTQLEERGYVAAHKEFVRRKPRTTYTVTSGGREAFQRYLHVLETIIGAAQPSQSAASIVGFGAGAALPTG